MAAAAIPMAAVTGSASIWVSPSMATSSRAPKHVWTKENEDTLVECLVELVSTRGWKSDNSHPTAKGLLNKPFPYYDEHAYVFERDRTTGRFAKIFVDVRFNEPT
uniref:Retrotransposon protein n=1 Tax=Cucumis melo TaxID=3656 RepID=A0A9I9E099_CUCME